jgi:sec-independent protein translocase protein TatA
MGLGWQELLIILVIVMVLFGGKKLPELAKSLGTSIRSFKDGAKGDAIDVTPPPAAPAQASIPAEAAPAGQLPSKTGTAPRVIETTATPANTNNPPAA